MPQIQLPIFPASSTPITRELAFQEKDAVVWYFNGHLPVISHPVADIASFRFFTSQLIANGNASQSEISRAFESALGQREAGLQDVARRGSLVIFSSTCVPARAQAHGATPSGSPKPSRCGNGSSSHQRQPAPRRRPQRTARRKSMAKPTPSPTPPSKPYAPNSTPQKSAIPAPPYGSSAAQSGHQFSRQVRMSDTPTAGPDSSIFLHDLVASQNLLTIPEKRRSLWISAFWPPRGHFLSNPPRRSA